MNNKRVLALSLGLSATAAAQVPDLYDPTTIRDVYLNFPAGNWYSQLLANYGPEINIPANMVVDGVTYPNVGVRFRGNTSYTMLPSTSEKRSFNIELDWMVPGQDIYGYDHLNFNNGYHDPTFLREFLTYWVMRRHGVAPKCNFVNVWCNGVNWGLYINVQQPNKDMMKEWFRSNDGNRYRCFPTSGSFGNGRCCYTVLSPNVAASYLSAYQAKQGDGVDLMNMCTVLNSMTTATPQSTLTAVFNVDSFYRYAAVMNVCTNTDSYLQSGKDHFLYIDEIHGDGSTFPFDLNEGLAGSSTLDPWYQTTNTFRPAFTKTLQFPDWRERYKAHLRTVVEQSFNTTWLTPTAQQYHAMIAPRVAADTKKLYSTTLFNNNLTGTVTLPFGSPSTITGLLPLIAGRETFLRNHADLNQPRTALSNLGHAPVSPTPVQSITFNVTASNLASTVKLYHRAVGPFASTAMFDDGLHGDGGAGDGVFGAILPPQAPGALIDYYVEAKTGSGLATYLPHTAEAEIYCPHIEVGWPIAPSPIAINEFVAQNVNGPVDEAGQHEDWLELYNTSNTAQLVGGMWLSDSLTQLKWQIPAGTSIAPNGVLRIWCDEDGTQGPLHASFKLSSTGELVALWNAAGTTLHDSFAFGLQAADVSTGRVFDGGPLWAMFPQPTYLARNEQTVCGTRQYAALMLLTHATALAMPASPQIGTSPAFDVTSGPAAGLALLALAFAPAHIDLGPLGLASEVGLVDPASLTVFAAILLNGSGAGSQPLAIPNNLAYVGMALYSQAFAFGGPTIDTSNAVELKICP
jgi:hypothetical protein